ncbi:MAG: hypothetical protein LBQ22_09135 [Bacteroidales bacterium]|jgi:hypothetical protein|nr:hypothetical protein [Bacteroidales bacterium]
MLFPVNDENEANELYDYFQEAINGYKYLQNKSEFLFVGFCFKKRDFYYIEIIK